MNAKNYLAGYSLYELIVTLGLAAVVLSVGIPSFSGLVAEHRLRTEANALFHAIHVARKESIMRRRVVTICASVDALTCLGSTDWSIGWIMFANDSMQNTDRRNSSEPLLMTHKVAPNTLIRTNRKVFSLRSTRLRATNGTLVLCDQNKAAEARALVVSYTGRPRVARRNRSGEAYQCTD